MLEKEKCLNCGEEATVYCKRCDDGWGRSWYCSSCFEKIVMTGNCCRGNEKDYETIY